MLEFPPAACGVAVELLFLGAHRGRSCWAWRTDNGELLAPVEGEPA